MMDHKKYTRQFYMPPTVCRDWAEKEYIEKAPIWCSVDLRDGNQALVVPMSLEQKLEYYKMLLCIGFKEIEVGFPASNETEYQFIRTLIEQNLIPDDVTIQVLTQAREQIIQKTFEAVRGAKHVIVHVYNPISYVQREQVFEKSREEILQIAVESAAQVKELAGKEEGDIRFEYSPESFTGTEPEFALQVCNAVLDVWKPTAEKPAIINLPSTVQISMPHVYASQIEYISKNLKYRDHVILSLHPHNDRGCSVSDAELGLLAGAQRVEGTLFGNGERTGNVDLVTLAMNLYAQGIDPGLDFSDMPQISQTYEHLTGMKVDERSPYSGALVFAAFSGSHQDAISKGIHYRTVNNQTVWTVPYLPIDPADIGRSYDANVIRINSQSGKGGVEYILEQHYGLRLPKKMREAMGYAAKKVSDELHKELTPEEVFEIFKKEFEDATVPYQVKEVHFKQHNGILAKVTAVCDGIEHTIGASGNGRLNAVSNALKRHFRLSYDVVTYEEHALEESSRSRAIAYVGIRDAAGNIFWGAGVDADIIKASIDALVTAINHMASGH